MEAYEFKTFDLIDLMRRGQKAGNSFTEGIDFLGTKKPYPENMPPLW